MGQAGAGAQPAAGEAFLKILQSLLLPGGIVHFKCTVLTRILRTIPSGKYAIWPPSLVEGPSGKGEFSNHFSLGLFQKSFPFFSATAGAYGGKSRMSWNLDSKAQMGAGTVR